MKGHIVRSLLLIILVCALVNSQARTLKEDADKLTRKYGRPSKPPPPAPYSAPPIHNLGRDGLPFPKLSTQIIQMIISSRQGENKFGILKNYGRKATSPPPAPKLPPSPHQLTGGRVAAAAEKSSENLFQSAL